MNSPELKGSTHTFRETIHILYLGRVCQGIDYKDNTPSGAPKALHPTLKIQRSASLGSTIEAKTSINYY